MDEQFKMGWLKDPPDLRDYTLDSEEVKQFVVAGAKDVLLPIDQIEVQLPSLREQGRIGSCTGHAGNYMLDVHQKVAGWNPEPLSRRFLYKVTRNLLGWTGDTGAYLRTTMQTIAMIGVPPERYWPYNEVDFDVEPTAFIYALAQDFKGLTYYRLDPPETLREEVIIRIKTNVKLDRACMFGFRVYGFSAQGEALLPAPGAPPQGGHAVTVVAYDDTRQISHPDGSTTTGAFKFANWWGANWGSEGFGWLPYDFVRKGIATDWWTMMSLDWIDQKQFS